MRLKTLLLFGLVIVLGISGYYLHNANAQGQGQGRGQQVHPGMQPDGTFVAADGTVYASQKAFVDSGMRCGFRHEGDGERGSGNSQAKPGGGGGGGSREIVIPITLMLDNKVLVRTVRRGLTEDVSGTM